MRMCLRPPKAPTPPPMEFEMVFNRDEGWAVLGALNEWIARHPDAAHRETWKEWARNLEKLLRG